MDQQGKTCIEFDYTSFLGATGSKKMDLFRGICHHRAYFRFDVETEHCGIEQA
ncbi:hypothetical protein JCM19053_4974 [Vibrio sp. JCM 19053]|nr:hypothetical protein JCM19053_4974 [Vibrio sp. JCM 19053]